MTQPAKVQEPSMEEILASIRRIIADDEAKPPIAEKPASPAAPAKPAAPAAKAPAMTDIPPSAIPAAQAAAKVAPPPAKPAPPPPAAPAGAPVSNSQDDIDALLNGLDEATSPEEIRTPLPDGDVFELTDEMALPEPAPRRLRSRRSNREDDLEFTETAARAALRQPAFEPPPFESAAPPAQQILSRTTVSAVEFRLQFTRQYRAEQQCADAGRSRQGNAAADAEILARRQSAGPGRAHRQGRNRAGFPRALASGPSPALIQSQIRPNPAYRAPVVLTWRVPAAF